MQTSRSTRRPAFTLVELLVVIAIIGVLAALLIPTVYAAMVRAKNTRISLEIAAMAKAIEAYKIDYGDYPPDFSDRATLVRHINMVFPRITPAERNNFLSLVYPNDDGISRVDPAEALVFFLGGFSKNPQLPFTGSGGPFRVVQGVGTFYNPDRNPGLFDFEQGRLTIIRSGANLLSNDEELLHGDATQNDPFPVYKPQGQEAPYVYFDARTYGAAAYAPPGMGWAVPYRSSDPVPAGSAPAWQEPKTYQILSAGLDDVYGADNFVKQFPVGTNYDPGRADHDNITNFSSVTLEDHLP